MGIKYSSDIYAAAEQTLAERRRTAEAEHERRKAYVYSKLPEVEAMQQRLKENYLTLVRGIVGHEQDISKKAESVKEKGIADRQRIRLLVGDLTGDPDYLEVPYTCKKCSDTGYHLGFRCSCMEELLKAAATEDLNKRSTIALRSFNEFDESCYSDERVRSKMANLKKYLEDYCAHFPQSCRSLIFRGRTGLGKTFLSSCMASALAQRGYTVAIGSASELLRAVENEHFGRSEGDTMSLLLAADMLIIDDLGSEFSTPFNESALYSVLNGRINLRRISIISTNMTVEKINERYNERIASRIIGEFMPISFVGADLRQSGK